MQEETVILNAFRNSERMFHTLRCNLIIWAPKFQISIICEDFLELTECIDIDGTHAPSPQPAVSATGFSPTNLGLSTCSFYS
jgi:hypothetical protein